MTPSEYTRLQADIARLADRASKAEGVYEREVSELSCEGFTPEEAVTHLASLDQQAREAEADADAKLAAFKAKWGDKLQ